MPAAKLSISLSPELDQALDVLAARTGRPKSAVIEMALRENPLVMKYIEAVRLEEHAELAAVPGRGRRLKATERRPVQRASP